MILKICSRLCLMSKIIIYNPKLITVKYLYLSNVTNISLKLEYGLNDNQILFIMCNLHVARDCI